MNLLINYLKYLITKRNTIKDKNISNLLQDLIEIIYTVHGSNSNREKKRNFDIYCYSIKKILDYYKLSNNKYFLNLNTIRNILAHDILDFELTDKGFVLKNENMINKINHNSYYINKDGTISYLKFMSYYILLFSREISNISELETNSLNIEEIKILEGLNIISCQNIILDSIHDEYIDWINKIYRKIDVKNITYDKKFINDNLDALSWLNKNDITFFIIDYMHIHISLGINSIDLDEVIVYLNKALNIIDKISSTYSFVWIYKIYVYNKLSTSYFLEKDKDEAYFFANLCMNLLNTSFEKSISLYNKIIFNLTFANALYLYAPEKENNQLKICMELLLLAEEKKLKNLEEYKFNIFNNYIKSCNLFKLMIPDNYLNYIISFYDGRNISKVKKHDIIVSLCMYYLNNQRYKESYKLLEIISKYKSLSELEKLGFEIQKLEIRSMLYFSTKSKLYEVKEIRIGKLINQINNFDEINDVDKNKIISDLEKIKAYLIEMNNF